MVHRQQCYIVVVYLAVQSVALAASQAGLAHWREAIARGDENRRLGKYVEARQSYQEALAEAEKFDSNDERLAATLNNLAALLFDYGNATDAEPLYRRALAIFERAESADRNNLANVLNNL